MSYRDVITIDPDRRYGKPCIRQTEITVDDGLGYLAAGRSVAEIINDFPELTASDIRDCLNFVAEYSPGKASNEASESASTTALKGLKLDLTKAQPRLQELAAPPSKPMLRSIIQPFAWMEKRIWEPILSWGENQALISLLGLLGNLGLLIAVLTYIGLEKQRREAQVYLAWQTITNAQGQRLSASL
jgi:uncharacterized protein (DUF433 family)